MIINSISNGKKIKLVNDIYVNFLYIKDLVYATELIIRNNCRGVYNVSGDEVINRYELGQRICDTMNIDYDLIEVTCETETETETEEVCPIALFDFKLWVSSISICQSHSAYSKFRGT